MKAHHRDSHPVIEAIDRGLKVVRWLFLLAALLYALSGIKQIQPNEAAMILRFGRLVGATRAEQVHGAGLLLAFPYPVDEVIRVPIREVRELAIDDLWAPAAGRGRTTPGSLSIDPTVEGYCLTGDQYIIQPRMMIKYQVIDPIAFYLRQEDSIAQIRDAVMTEMNRSVGEMDVDQVLTEGKRRLAGRVQIRSQRRLDGIGTGVSLVAVEFKEIVPPRHVIHDFQAVVSATIQRRTMIKEALAYKAEQKPRAEMEANSLKSQAKSFKHRTLARVKSDLARFHGVYEQYRKDPDIVRTRLFREAMEDILTNVGGQYILPPVGSGQKPPTYRLLLPPE